MADKPLISQDEMASVLGSDAEGQAADEHKNTATRGPFSLRRPTVLGPDEYDAANDRLEEIASTLRGALGQALRSDVGLETAGLQQQQVSVALGRVAGPVWVLNFACEQSGGIALGFDATSALAVVELALGGAGTYGAEGRAPTRLESRLMTTLGRNVTKTLSKTLGMSLQSNFTCERISSRLGCPNEIIGATLLKLVLAGSERNGLLLTSIDLLRPTGDSVEDADTPKEPVLSESLGSVGVTSDIALATRPLCLRELSEFRKGQCVELGVRQEAEWTLRANSIDGFIGNLASRPDGMTFTVDRQLRSIELKPEVAEAPLPAAGEVDADLVREIQKLAQPDASGGTGTAEGSAIGSDPGGTPV